MEADSADYADKPNHQMSEVVRARMVAARKSVGPTSSKRKRLTKGEI